MPRTPLTWFTVAALVGTVHAAASLYWALGGDALADTVGAWAVAWRTGSPVAAALSLGAIGLVKLAAAWVPWRAARSGGPRGALRLVCWAGAAVLVAYGLANAVAANLALAGILGPVLDVTATRGHAWLWDPMFLAWGLALGVGLWWADHTPGAELPRRPGYIRVHEEVLRRHRDGADPRARTQIWDWWSWPRSSGPRRSRRRPPMTTPPASRPRA